MLLCARKRRQIGIFPYYLQDYKSKGSGQADDNHRFDQDASRKKSRNFPKIELRHFLFDLTDEKEPQWQKKIVSCLCILMQVEKNQSV